MGRPSASSTGVGRRPQPVSASKPSSKRAPAARTAVAIASSHASRSIWPRARSARNWPSSRFSSVCSSSRHSSFFLALGVLQRPIAERLPQAQQLRGALLELVKGGDLAAVMGDLLRVLEAARHRPSALVLVGIEHVRTAPDLGAVLVDGFHKLLGDGAAADLLEVLDLVEEGTALGVELGDGRSRGIRHGVVVYTTLYGSKKRENRQTPRFCHAPCLTREVGSRIVTA